MTRVIAHRGARNEAPENTLASLGAACDIPGLYGIEFDVELADKPLVLHQETMVPNEDFTALREASRDFKERDWVSEHSAEEIGRLDAGSWMDRKFSSLRVPLLSEVLAINWADKHIFVELKDPTYWGERNPEHPGKMVAAVLPLLRKQSLPISVISFNPEILRILKHHAPDIPGVLALWFEWQNAPQEAIAIATEIQASAISIPDQMLLERKTWIKQTHDAGMEVHAFPVSPAIDEPGHAGWNPQSRESVWDSLIDLNVNAILTDFPRELLAHLSERTR